ncbi:MAG TPA: hypothetical protein VNE62_01050 [Actinomycetota bacterium]|nr:hypothetical protein [Actinomycetota bacterium]
MSGALLMAVRRAGSGFAALLVLAGVVVAGAPAATGQVAPITLEKTCINATTGDQGGESDPIEVEPGDRIDCTIVVRNNTAGNLENLILTDNVPPQTQIQQDSIVSTSSTLPGFACTVQQPSPELQCSDAVLPPAATNTVTYTVIVTQQNIGPGFRFQNDAQVHCDQEGCGARDSVQFTTPPCTIDARFATSGRSITGTQGKDVICGSRYGDSINGLGGDDTIFGFGGNDAINGGYGNDRILGGSGNDAIRGSYGDDRILGQSGDDSLRGDEGFDRIDGGTGVDACSGEVKVAC